MLIMEEWRSIEGFKDYHVSSLGRVKSLKHKKEKILKGALNSYGYRIVNLSVNGVQHSRKVHKLVAGAFLGHVRCGYKEVVDHINNNKDDNRLVNLQLITARENVNKDIKRGASKYRGVTIHKPSGKWMAQITINGKHIYLGLFNCEIKASIAYQKKLKESC